MVIIHDNIKRCKSTHITLSPNIISFYLQYHMTRLRQVLSLVLLCVFATSLSASAAKRVFTGRVLNALDSVPVAAAICTLMDGNTDIMASHTDQQGVFSITTDVTKPLKLIIKKDGYIDTDVSVAEGKHSIQLGDIYIFKGTTLDEVTVTAQTVIHSRGKSIVYPGGEEVKSAYDALELLQKLPLAGLVINPNDKSISVRGGKPYIQIDGVPATMQELLALSPDSILRIDFSRETPMRYAGQGYTGMLEVTLKQRTDGGSVRVEGGVNVVTLKRLDGGLNLEYHEGKSQFRLNVTDNYNNKYTKTPKIRDIDRVEYKAPGFSLLQDVESDSKLMYNNLNINSKYNYRASESTLWSAAFNVGVNPRKNYMDEHGTELLNGVTRAYDAIADFKNHDNTYSLDLFMRHEFNANNGIEAQVVGTLSSSDSRAMRSYTFQAPVGSETVDPIQQTYDNSVTSLRRSLISEINWFSTLCPEGVLKLGYRNTLSRTDNDYTAQQYRPRMTDNTHYLFTGWGHTVGRAYYEVSTGVRGTWNNSNGTHDRYFNNVTQINTAWQPSQKVYLSANLSYSASIPSLSQVADYKYQQNPYLFVTGNPTLRAQHNFTSSATLTYSPHRKVQIEFVESLQRMWNLQTSLISYEGDGKFVSRPENVRYGLLESTGVTLQVSDIKGFGFGGSTSLCYGNFAGSTFTNRGWWTDNMVFAWWMHGPFTISYYHTLPGMARYSDSRYTANETINQIQASYRLGKSWAFNARWMWPFNKKGWVHKTETLTDVYTHYSHRSIIDEVNGLVISCSYTGDFGTIFNTGRRTLQNTDRGGGVLRDSGN